MDTEIWRSELSIAAQIRNETVFAPELQDQLREHAKRMEAYRDKTEERGNAKVT